MKRKNQLLKLWNSEITSIAKRRGCRVYMGKSKSFRAGELVKKIDDETLRKEICSELFERDYRLSED